MFHTGGLQHVRYRIRINLASQRSSYKLTRFETAVFIRELGPKGAILEGSNNSKCQVCTFLLLRILDEPQHYVGPLSQPVSRSSVHEQPLQLLD